LLGVLKTHNWCGFARPVGRLAGWPTRPTIAVGSDNMFDAFWTDTNNKQNVVWFYGLERLSARSVFGPKMPSAVSPWAPWKPATACLVAGP